MNLVNEGVLPPDELDDRDERCEEQERARSRETLADIMAEIRAYGAQPPPRCMWLDIADRLEAAAKRDEERAVEHATRHAEAVARDNCRDCVHNPRGKNYEGGNAAAMRDIVTALANVILPPRGKADEDGWLAWVRAMQAKSRAALADATTEKSSTVGNAAAMREALSDACYAMFNFLKTQSGGYEEMAIALDKAKAALSAPPRNCDRFQVAAEALQEWQSLVKAKPNTWDFRYNYWLFAPAVEREGDGDGSK